MQEQDPEVTKVFRKRVWEKPFSKKGFFPTLFSFLSERNMLGFGLLIFACFLFSVLTALLKVAAEHVNFGQVIFYRFIIALVVLRIARGLGWFEFKPVNKKWLVLRGTFGASTGLLYYAAVYYGTITHTVLLNSTNPIFVAMLSGLIIGERVGNRVILPLIASMVGLFFIIKPSGGVLPVGDVLALVSGVGVCLDILAVRKLRETDLVMTVIYYHCLIGTVVTFPFLFLGYRAPDAIGITLILILTFLATFAQAIFTAAYRYTRASEGSIITLSSVVFSCVWAVMFFSETFDTATLIGAALILGSGIFISQGSEDSR